MNNNGVRVLSERPSPAGLSGMALEAKTNGNCPNCATPSTNGAQSALLRFVYAVGRIVPQFPDLGVEKEFAQLGGRADQSAVETNRLIEILKDPSTAYLARQIAWVFVAAETESFNLIPRDDAQLKQLVDSLPRAENASSTVQVIVGSLGPLPLNSIQATSGLPVVGVDQHLTFTLESFIDALAKAGVNGKEEDEPQSGELFRRAAHDLFLRLTRRSDNRGTSDEHRAANYVALRYPPLYHVTAEKYRQGMFLADVQLRRGMSSGRQTVVIRLSFRAHRTDLLEHYQCTVDVSDKFPFLATPISAIYD